MAIQTFDELYGQTMELYGQQAFGDALTLLTEHGERFPEHAPMILYLRSCLAARSEQPELALDLVQQALDRGFWYGEQVMRETPSW